ncbi:MAG TPA: glycosyl hydrolase [Aliidongia sp.]|nr:glycosyl hydrolase [Aliidongia sp.]
MRIASLITSLIGIAFLATRPAAATEIGLYAGAGCDGVAHLATYNAWLGSPAVHVTENFDQSTWAALKSDAGWSIGCYASVRNSVSMTFSIPMLPGDGVSTLAKGAAGAYDATFTSIAQSLVSAGFATTTVRIGWEMNGNFQPWASYKDNTNFIAYYQRIVKLMKAVTGARFQFEWCPNVGTGSLAPDQSYPGDAYVDIIGMDVYEGHYSAGDALAAARWNWYVTEPFGLQWQVTFAKAHMKRLSLPEWGCCSNNAGDDPYFVNQIAAWLTANSYLYADYWDSNAVYVGQLSNNQYPLAGGAYKADFK